MKSLKLLPALLAALRCVAMKKVILLLLILCVVGIKPTYSQKELIIETDDSFNFRNVRMDLDGNYVSTFMRNRLNLSYQTGLIKFNDSLEYQLYYHQKDSNYVSFRDVIVTDENNYLIAGTIGTQYYYDHTIYILLLDKDFNTIEESFYELPEQYPNPIVKMLKSPEGKIFIIITRGSVSGMVKGIIEISPQAEIIDAKMYYNMGYTILNPFPNPDGGLFLFREFMGNAFAGITRVDTNLNFDTTFYFPESLNGITCDMGTNGCCKWLNDSVYIICTQGFFETPTLDLYLYKVSKQHQLLTVPFYVGNPTEHDICPPNQSIDWVDPQNIYTVGYMSLSMSNRSTYYVSVINQDFELLGAKVCGGDYNTWINSIIATADGGCIMVGARRDYHSGNTLSADGYIAIFHPDDIITSAQETSNPNDSDYMLFPNPGSDQLNIQTARKGVKIEMFDQTGRMVFQQKLTDEFRNVIFTNNLPAGLYHCKLTDREEFVENIKWVKH